MRYSSLPIAVKAFIALFFGLALFAPLPFVVVMPGGATDVLDKVISIKSENSYKPTGSLYLLAVRVTSPDSAMFSGGLSTAGQMEIREFFLAQCSIQIM